ncbi:MAG: M56 family metallopeptidase [Egibacteraceae bacterium]
MESGSGELFVLLIESFAVRAMLGSLAAAALAALVVRRDLVRTARARRLLVLAPLLTAAVAGVASLDEAFLPQLWVSTSADGSSPQLLDLLGELRVVTDSGRFDLLVMSYAGVLALLLCRRALSVAAVRWTLRQARPPRGFGALVPIVHRLAGGLGIAPPRLLMLPGCPGGAFTSGTFRPVIAVDPALVATLDERELEGLLAHELAHVQRRDPLLWLLTGVFRDAVFFLPPVHAAGRWLRREQEESADERASELTGKPGSLASGILKVWAASGTQGQPLSATCAVVAMPRVALAGGGFPRSRRSVPHVGERVRRLIERPARPTPLRRRVELGVAGAVTVTAVGAALGVPAWVTAQYDTAGVGLGALTAPPVMAVEAPAFATFRELAPEPGQVVDAPGEGAAAAVGGRASWAEDTPDACACIESRADLALRRPAAANDGRRGLVWMDHDHRSWQLLGEQPQPVRSTRPLWTLQQAEQQVGVFLLGATR